MVCRKDVVIMFSVNRMMIQGEKKIYIIGWHMQGKGENKQVKIVEKLTSVTKLVLYVQYWLLTHSMVQSPS